jgi:hypothetical protein
MFGRWHVTEAMIIYGGGFVQGLGRLFRSADADNQKRLIAAFPEYFKEYTAIARQRESQLESPVAADGPKEQP